MWFVVWIVLMIVFDTLMRYHLTPHVRGISEVPMAQVLGVSIIMWQELDNVMDRETFMYQVPSAFFFALALFALRHGSNPLKLNQVRMLVPATVGPSGGFGEQGPSTTDKINGWLARRTSFTRKGLLALPLVAALGLMISGFPLGLTNLAVLGMVVAIENLMFKFVPESYIGR